MKHILIILLLLAHTAFIAAAEESSKKQKSWNIQETPEHIYRLIEIDYISISILDDEEMKFFSITPPPSGLSAPDTRAGCNGQAAARVLDAYASYFTGTPVIMTLRELVEERGLVLRVLLGDEDAGIIVDKDESGDYDVMRFICLPMDLIDDLDLVGTEYDDTQMASDVERMRRSHNERHKKGISDSTYEGFLKKYPEVDLILPDDDPRHHIRYDAARFFARFEQYGVTRTLPIPDIKVEDELHWNNEEWGTRVFIFPLDQSNE